MIYGYARVSTDAQDTVAQLDALAAARVDQVHEEKCSGVGPRPVLRRLVEELVGPGDVLVVYKLDRMARSLKDLLHLLDVLKARGCAIRSLTEPIDTSSAMGEFVLQILGAVAQLERAIIRERCAAGLKAAVERGLVLGRPRAFDAQGEELVADMYRAGVASVDQLAAIFGVKRGAIRGPLCRAGLLMPGYSGRAR